MLESINSFFGDLFYFLGGIYPGAKMISGFLLGVVSFFYIHKGLYWVIGFFFTRKFPEAKKQHKYAILVPARNEEPVIANLIDSIHRQDYPQDMITIFVVADNCTDNTAKVAREKGAICYERFNDKDRTKGFALQFLFENIKRDYGIEAFEGYFIFDSDNLLNRDYVTRMNEAFDAGEKIITSYRNTKNFDENWVASTYALHWLRSIRQNHRARSVLHLATNIQGTGFLFANELVKDGWKYTSLTEDRAFTADAVAHGYEISYNDAAMFYDEQPVSLRIALRQRTRWAKGHLLAFVESGWPLFKNIFVGNCFKDKTEKHKFTKENILEGIRHRLASFDTLGQLVPSAIIRLFCWLIVSLFLYSCAKFRTGLGPDVNGNPVLVFTHSNLLQDILNYIFGDIEVSAAPGFKAMWYAFLLSILWHNIGRIAYNIKNMWAAVYVFIVERKKIKKIRFWKKVLYCLTWPTFDMIGRYAMYVALFKKVTWKPIPHNSKVTIADIENSGIEELERTAIERP